MSLSSVDVVCKKCKSTFFTMHTIKSVKDVIRSTNEGRCSICGTVLNPSDFTVTVEKRY